MWSCHSELSRAPVENTAEGFRRKHKLGAKKLSRDGVGERERENSRAASKAAATLIFKVTVHMHHYDKKKKERKKMRSLIGMARK